ncbi:ABC transporter ATP-binding protein [Corynebacterium yudongzhengii]|uniref:ABC transporter ATP-binding protein n=1 Tax=Corynebacterium yudongzhengii TaxID=2080740 RepID=A0A2U1T4L6_9CORY|nr:ABC transporter ATP-binding protein [Corynebacterium yudongzhengii]AWB82704.1 ABC transporter ATP-binding protein [Corynebacterium yudongzhengii]PWC00947.1 ABC transporter ATP-binding protein [Corynebacterium yudongzhengii]
MAPAPIITVHELTHTYGRGDSAYTAVKNSSFTVARGEVFGLLGTNGAGKTTTLEIMEGLRAPTGGEVSILGLDPLTERARLRPYMGIMLQSGGLPAELSARHTLAMWAGICAAPRDIDEVLADVELTHRADLKVGAMSGGEQRRLDLACALIGDPLVLFLDEPTTGLDPQSRRNVWALLERLKERGVTMVLTTHYLEEAERLCDRVAIMHEGEIVVAGVTDEIAATASSELSAHLPVNHPPLPAFNGAHVSVDGVRLVITTDDLQAHAAQMLRWAEDNELALGQFTATPASLESVFLAIADQRS